MFLILLRNIFAVDYAIRLFENPDEAFNTTYRYVYSEIKGPNVFKAHYFRILFDGKHMTKYYPIYRKDTNELFLKYEKSNLINRYKAKHRKMYETIKVHYNTIKNNQYVKIFHVGNKVLENSYYQVHKSDCPYQYNNEKIRNGLIIVLERANFGLQIRRSDPTFDQKQFNEFQIILYDRNLIKLGITHGAPY